jgi:hypothetical protein
MLLDKIEEEKNKIEKELFNKNNGDKINLSFKDKIEVILKKQGENNG